MTEATNGDTVKVHYTARFDDGSVFQTSREGQPVEFKIGEGQVLSAFENQVAGMHPGESKTATLRAQEAYGPYRKDLKLAVDRSLFPTGPEVGKEYGVQQKDGSFYTARVIGITGSEVLLDANHSLAGKDLTFEIELLEIH